MSAAVRNLAPSSRRTYISSETFTSAFRAYTTRVVDFDTIGIWSAVTTDNSLCPPGRTLRENGRYLYPGANPNVDQYYVGVYDAVTSLNGFIDPNAPMFAEYNTNKPVYLADNVTGNGADGPDLSNPVYTQGIVETLDPSAETFVRLNPDGTILTTGDVTVGEDIAVAGNATITGNLDLSGNIRIGSGGTVIQRVTTGTVAVNFNVPADSRITQPITVSGMSNGDMVFIQYTPSVDRRLFYVGHDTDTNLINLYVNNTHNAILAFDTTITYMWFKM